MSILYTNEELANMPLIEYFRKADKDYILSADKTRMIRVAVYARVSTEHEEQVEALKNQIQWYKDLIDKHPNWLFDFQRHLYVDEGISATSERHRKAFEQMKKAEDITEQLKEENQLEWAQRMFNIQSQAGKFVEYEMIFR